MPALAKIIAAGLVSATSAMASAAPIAADVNEPGASTAEPITYRYALSPEAAHECGTLQLILSEAKQQSDPLWSTRHSAMSLSWYIVVGLLRAEPYSDQEAEELTERTIAKFPGGEFSLEAATELAKPCQVMKVLYRGYYDQAVTIGEEDDPALFADNAAQKRQIGGEYPDAPTKELIFDNWYFFAKGNLCFATPLNMEKGKLTLGFNNFFDGSIMLDWAQLPELNDENYEADIAKHRKGITWRPEEEVMLPVFEEGVTYDNFEGSGLFIDEVPIAMLSGQGVSHGTDYRFGAAVQEPYFTLMAAGKVLSIKILGEETHRMRIDKPDMWNELSECMAQYPFG